VLLQDGILCRCPLSLWCHSILEFLCLDGLSISDKGVLKSPTTTVLGSISIFNPIVCLIKLGAPTLGTYKLMIVISSWCIAPFISVEELSSLNSILILQEMWWFLL
jgi:hypothetical protein